MHSKHIFYTAIAGSLLPDQPPELKFKYIRMFISHLINSLQDGVHSPLVQIHGAAALLVLIVTVPVRVPVVQDLFVTTSRLPHLLLLLLHSTLTLMLLLACQTQHALEARHLFRLHFDASLIGSGDSITAVLLCPLIAPIYIVHLPLAESAQVQLPLLSVSLDLLQLLADLQITAAQLFGDHLLLLLQLPLDQEDRIDQFADL